METKSLLEIFDCERQCEYKGRTYRVRDNGAIMRLPKEGGRYSRQDRVWTFGIKNETNGYMIFTGDVRVHQVVCTAFHGAALDKNMIVDHINGNRCDNRPDNLRWITREENVFDNPLTAKKMEYRFGSIDAAKAALHNDPVSFRRILNEQESDKSWMRPVSKEEADNHAKRNEELDEAKEWTRGMEPSPFPSWREQVAAAEEATRRLHMEALELKDSLTPGAKQLEWKIPTEFPQTPQEITATPLQDYLSRLSKGVVFSRNKYGESPVFDAAMAEDGSHLAVITDMFGASGVKKYALAEVWFSDGQFIHKSIRTFFQEDGAIKYYTLSLGREWKGGDVFDDFC